jgi:hypothetical protein
MNRVRRNTANDTQLADRSDSAAATSSPYDPRDPWLEMNAAGVITSPPPGEPGHGCTAVLRSQPTLIVDGRAEGGYIGAFELICCECGDNPDLDYSGSRLACSRYAGRTRSPRALPHMSSTSG